MRSFPKDSEILFLALLKLKCCSESCGANKRWTYQPTTSSQVLAYKTNSKWEKLDEDKVCSQSMLTVDNISKWLSESPQSVDSMIVFWVLKICQHSIEKGSLNSYNNNHSSPSSSTISNSPTHVSSLTPLTSHSMPSFRYQNFLIILSPRSSSQAFNKSTKGNSISKASHKSIPMTSSTHSPPDNKCGNIFLPFRSIKQTAKKWAKTNNKRHSRSIGNYAFALPPNALGLLMQKTFFQVFCPLRMALPLRNT